MYYPAFGVNQPSINSQFFLPMSGNMSPNPLNYNYPNVASNSYLRFKEKQVEPNIEEEYLKKSKIEEEYKRKAKMMEEEKQRKAKMEEEEKQIEIKKIEELKKYNVLNKKLDENIKKLDSLIELANDLSKQKQELLSNLK